MRNGLMASPHQAPYLSLFQRNHSVFHKDLGIDFSRSLPTWSVWTCAKLSVYLSRTIHLHRMIHGMLGTESTTVNSYKKLVYAFFFF